MKATIAILPGDGIGPEVMAEAVKVLRKLEARFGHQFDLLDGLIGGAAYDKFGEHFPEVTRQICQNADAILFGSVGGPVHALQEAKWAGCEAKTILSLRKTFNFNANIRPIRIFPELAALCPLRDELVEGGVDIVFIRELIGDIYFGEHSTAVENGQRVARDVAEYTEEQIASVAHIAFKTAMSRSSHVTSIDKANVLDTSKLWRSVVTEIHKQYPSVKLEHMLVDNCAMQIIKNPRQFDVVLTSNMFGDILSDAAAVLPGSLGILCSASSNADGFALYEPPGGSAQDISGQGVANPIGQILCVAMMLRHSFSLEAEANAIEAAVKAVLRSGLRTKDIAQSGEKAVSTVEMGNAVVDSISK